MNVKLKEIRVDGYKNLINCESEIHDFNILVGPNNSGKSNFLETFNILKIIIEGNEEQKNLVFEKGLTYRGNLFTQLNKYKNRPITIALVAETDNPALVVTYELVIGSVHEQEKKGNKEKKTGVPFAILEEVLFAKDPNKTGPPIILFERKALNLKVRRLSNKFGSHKLDRSTISAFEAIPSLYPGQKGLSKILILSGQLIFQVLDITVFVSQPNELRNQINKGGTNFLESSRISSFDLISAIEKIEANDNIYNQFISALCQVLDLEDAKLQTFMVPDELRKEMKDIPERISFFGLKMKGQELSPIESFSDGTLMVTAILLAVLSPEIKTPLICIEEPENCLHPKALKTLLSYLVQKSHEKQILITTHSSYILNQVNPEDVIVARVNQDGETSLEKIKNIKELHKKLRSGYVSFGDLLEREFSEDEGEDF